MPTYQYECKNCQHTFEQYQSIHDDPLLRCPCCDTHSLFRVITGGLYCAVRKSDSDITLGHLADRNRSKFSDDQKEHLEIKHTPPGCKPFPKDFGVKKEDRTLSKKAKDLPKDVHRKS